MSSKDFLFTVPNKVIFKEGAINELGNVVDGKCVFIMTTEPVWSNNKERVLKSLEGKEVYFYNQTTAEPTTDCINEALKIVRAHDIDTVIGFGGGSCMDASKLISCLAKNNDDIFDYEGHQDKLVRGTKLILIPTTSGTGSEVTKVGVFTNSNTNFKFNYRPDCFKSDYSLVDPELTYTVPKKTTANSGIDAFTHAIESYWTSNSNPVSDMVDMEAMRLILGNLKKAYDSPDDKEARSNMSLAALLAGIGFAQTSLTVGHACAYDFAFISHEPHGTCCSILIPALIKHASEKEAEKMNRLAKYLDFNSVEELSDAVKSLMESVNIPTHLKDLGVTDEDMQNIAKKALTNPNTLCTPLKKVDFDSLYQVLKETY